MSELGFYSIDDAEEFINLLFYGREGTGKTTAALGMTRLPGEGRVLVINAEGGVKRSALAKRGINTKRVVAWPPRGERVSFEGLEQVHRRLLGDLQDDPESWTGVVMDSLTEVTASLRENATIGRQQRLTAQGRSFDPNLIDISDYGQMTDQMRRIIRRYRDLPCHFVATALEREDEDGSTGPAMTPALATDVLGYVDFVLYTRATQATAEDASDALAEFRALTRPTAAIRAKDRLDVLPRVLAQPSFERVWQYATGELDEAEDTLQAEYKQRERELEAEQQAEREAKDAKRNRRKRGA